MKLKKFLYLFGVFLVLTLSLAHVGWAQPKPGTNAPVITHSFAVEKGYSGYTWKIYLEAEDPDGDMHKIASVVEHVGYGHYPTDWITLKAEYRHQLRGYIQWNNLGTRTLYLKDYNQITLKVSIIDKVGNESNVVVFPFTFLSGVKDQYKYTLPSPFDQGDLPRLGYIVIYLKEPTAGAPEND